VISAEPYPTPSPSQTSGILDQVTQYLTGLIPPGVLDSGAAATLTVLTVILAAVGHRHARQQNWCSGWCSGPLGIVTALWAASYAATGLPALAGVAPGDADPRTIVVEVVVALAVAVLIAGAVWPVEVHVAVHLGRPVSPLGLRDWAQMAPLHAAGGAGAGALLAWAVDPLLVVAGAALGLGITWLVEHLRGPQVPRSESAGEAHAAEGIPTPVPEHRATPPPISDEWG